MRRRHRLTSALTKTTRPSLRFELTVGMGFPLRMEIPWESYRNGTNIEEAMVIDCTGVGSSGNQKTHSRSS